MHDTSSLPSAPNRRPLVLVAAIARNRTIGAGNALPWRLPADLRRFRAITTGHTVVMGRRTWESIGRPLPGRENIVVSCTLARAPEGCLLAPSLQAALALASLPGPVFCIGGGELYRAALPLADRLELTEIDADIAGDAFFPSLDRAVWHETAREAGHDEASGLHFAFVRYERAVRRAA